MVFVITLKNKLVTYKKPSIVQFLCIEYILVLSMIGKIIICYMKRNILTVFMALKMLQPQCAIT